MDAAPWQRGSEPKKRRTGYALLEEALAPFAERGWHATTMEEVAETAGVSATTAHSHFAPTSPTSAPPLRPC
ncbi:helix-turn-helix domain-containing protein [Actinomadura macra]|uniref:helix-turn-helix domain-containing protein n=1 Tax=Actinomadura macra TaxID=46164 RepID=UPI0009FE3A4F